MRPIGCLTTLLAVVAVAVAPARGDESPTDRLGRELGGAAAPMKTGLGGDSAQVVAVLPFIDDLGGVRRLGFLAGEILEGKLVAGGVKVVDRSRLDALRKEKLAWMSDLFEDRDPAKRAEAAKFLQAHYLVLGTLVPAETEIVFSVRLIEVASGAVKAAKSFTIPRTADMQPLLWYVERPTKKLERPAEVPPIELAVSIRAQHKRPDGTVDEFTVRDGSVLHSRDQFQVRFTPRADCWVYIFLVGSTSKCETLFPYKGVKLGNFVRGGATYAVPDPDVGGSRWFFLDNNPGTETIYIVASYDKMKDLGTIVAEMNRDGGDAATAAAASERLMNAIDAVRRQPGRPPKSAPGLAVEVALPPASAAATGRPGEVLRGRYSCVRETRFVHR